jgi:CRP-like cAMP-binding protein
MSVINDPEALYEMLGRAGEKRVVSPGEVIFERGDRADSMFVLVSGTVVSSAARRSSIRLAHPGSLASWR